MEKIKVLLVEDEPALGLIVKESLEMRAFNVDFQQDGEAGLAAFSAEKPDICVLDVMMPKKDGFTLAKEIRERDPNTPIIFLTARSQTQDVVQGFQMGGNDYLKKPFSMEELIVRMEALLSRNTTSASVPDDTIVEIGDFIFDTKKQLLSNADSEKKLTHREAELLRMLYQQRNQVLERTVVLKALWGDDSFFNARSMDVFITKLRRYLKADPNVEIINVRGIGYKLIF